MRRDDVSREKGGVPARAVTPLYDEIGRRYATTRQADPRIARAIRLALGDAATVVNVGAGTGSYEPDDIRVVAVEPSREMIRQRPAGSAPVVQAPAEGLPFRSAAFDAALAVLTVHHWVDQARGLAELRRVAGRRVVVVTWDPAGRDLFWLTTEYFPDIVAIDVPRFPSTVALGEGLGAVDVRPLPVPRDCADGFLGAYWARPEAYLDPDVRRGISAFALLAPDTLREGINRLAADLRSGRWEDRFGPLRARSAIDLGYRIVVANRRVG